MDVLAVAWAAAGRPAVIAGDTGRGCCARCGQVSGLVPAGRAVSRNFSCWDGWADPSRPGLCQPCAWGHATPGLRTRPLYVTACPPELAYPGLPAVAEDGDGFAFERFADEGGNDAAVFEAHAGAVGVEDADDLGEIGRAHV